jgi:hypothetical protein
MKFLENNWGKVLFCIDIIRNFAIANLHSTCHRQSETRSGAFGAAELAT